MNESQLLPVLAQRWSPREFDPTYVVSTASVESLLEAARWAPSAGNSQPWSFHAVRRDEEGWVQLLRRLAGSSRPWAMQASLLMVNLAHVHVEGTDWEYSEFSIYDLGQAVAHMTIQAHSMGLACRQFRAFDRDAVQSLLRVPTHWQVVTMTAIGRPADTAERDRAASTREDRVDWPRR